MPVIFQTAIRRVPMWRTKTMAPYGRIFAPYAPKWDYDDPVRSRVPLWDIYNGCVLWLPPQRELSPGALVSPDHFQSHFRLYTSSKLSQRYPFECYRVAVPNSVLEAPAWPCIEKHWSLRYRIKGALWNSPFTGFLVWISCAASNNSLESFMAFRGRQDGSIRTSSELQSVLRYTAHQNVQVKCQSASNKLTTMFIRFKKLLSVV